MKKAMRIFRRDLRRLIHSPAAMLVMAGSILLPILILMQILQRFRLPLPIMIRMPPAMISRSMPVIRSWKI